MIDYNALNIPVDYDSPLIVNYINQISTDIAKFTEDGVMKAVIKAGFAIDKDKLIQILEQDKERYSEAYRKGFAEGYKKRDDEIVRYVDCIYFGNPKKCIVQNFVDKTNKLWLLSLQENWHCADGVRKDESTD